MSSGLDFDNLYIDMNGLIHPCCHPQSGPIPKNENEMMSNILNQLDRIVNYIRPKKFLFLSIDGPAPRAKMNQQRSRRFKSSMHRQNMEDAEGLFLESFGTFVSEEETKELSNKKWDSNVITPGTSFMEKVTETVRFWILRTMQNDTTGYWKNITILLSDSSVYGEGEQKIFSLVRKLRQEEGYNTQIKHCIHGLDADLVMLALLSHEPNFFILREDVFDMSTTSLEKPLHLVNVRRVREQLKFRLNLPTNIGATIKIDFQNVLDDFVFLLYLCGNDFLPNLYGMGIDHNGIDKIVRYYQKFVIKMYVNAQKKRGLSSEIVPPKVDVYLTSNGDIQIPNLLMFMRDTIIVDEDKYLRHHIERHGRKYEGEFGKETLLDVTMKDIDFEHNRKPLNPAPKQFRAEMEYLEEKQDDEKVSSIENIIKNSMKKRTIVFPPPRNILLNPNITDLSPGWKDRYLALKIWHADVSRGLSDDQKKKVYKARKEMAYSFLKGMIWIWRYYTSDNPSWDWYYPYHYPPFSQDFLILSEMEIRTLKFFNEGKPFKPFEQLMAVLPEASNHCLPEAYQQFLRESSVIGEFYPKNFLIDLNYHKKDFKAHALIPFIKRDKLIKIIKPLEQLHSDEEKIRNSYGIPLVFFHRENRHMVQVFSRIKREPNHLSIQVPSNFFLTERKENFFFGSGRTFGGYYFNVDFTKYPKTSRNFPFNLGAQNNSGMKSPVHGYRDLNNNSVVSALFFEPQRKITKFGDLVDFRSVRIMSVADIVPKENFLNPNVRLAKDLKESRRTVGNNFSRPPLPKSFQDLFKKDDEKKKKEMEDDVMDESDDDEEEVDFGKKKREKLERLREVTVSGLGNSESVPDTTHLQNHPFGEDFGVIPYPVVQPYPVETVQPSSGNNVDVGYANYDIGAVDFSNKEETQPNFDGEFNFPDVDEKDEFSNPIELFPTFDQYDINPKKRKREDEEIDFYSIEDSLQPSTKYQKFE